MAFEARIESVTDRAIAGYVYDDTAPNDAFDVEILWGERVIATVRADAYRADLQAAGKGSGNYGFAFTLERPADAAQPLEARVAGKRWRIQPLAAAYTDPRRRYLHTLEFGHPQVATGFTEAARAPDEAQIVERLIQAFHRARKDEPRSPWRKWDIWAEIESSRHGPMLRLLKRRDVEGLAGYLREAHANDVTWGITQGTQMTAALQSDERQRRSVATEYADNLASFAEYLGLLDLESPHQRGQWGENLHADPQAIVDQVGAQLGFPLETPAVIGAYFGLKTRGGIVTGRDLCALHAAMRLREIAMDLCIATPRVCEIGGGMGGVAYYAARMGMPFTIVDLATVGVLQGYFLLRALPDKQVRLFGEDEPAGSEPAIRLLPPHRFGAPGAEYDLLLNQDSFPEMTSTYSVAYLQKAAANVRHAFLSINQEARAPQAGAARQAIVRELVEDAGGKFKLASRFRHWLRPGDVEEVYKRSLPEPAGRARA
jgi:hypothetical protein